MKPGVSILRDVAPGFFYFTKQGGEEMSDNSDLGERIEDFLEENDLSPFITISRLIREAKIRGEDELATDVKETLGDEDLSLANRTSTLLDSLNDEDE
jgi:hypothetical protein